MRNAQVIRRNAKAALRLAALTVLFVTTFYSQKLPIRVFTSADGMASSIVHHVARDSKGFLWFCARGGLSRYDGEQFTSYRLTEDLNTPVVNYFLETRDGIFWIATDSGLFRINPDTPVETKPVEGGHSVERILNAAKVADIGFWSLFEDSDGRLWGGMVGLYLIEDRSAERVRPVPVDFASSVTAPTNAEIRSIAETQDRSVWIGYSEGVARRLPDGRFVVYRITLGAKGNHTLSVRVDPAGRIWLSSSTGVFVFKPAPIESLTTNVIDLPVHSTILRKTGTVELPDDPAKMLRLTIEGAGGEELATGIVRDLYADIDGRVWIPSRRGLFMFSGDSYERLLDPSIKLEVDSRIEKDLGGRLWFGSTVGAFRYSPDGLLTFDEQTGIVDPVVHSMQETTAGELVVFHGDWYMTRITREGVVSKRLEIPQSAQYAWTARPVFLDRDDNLWALTGQGLYKSTNDSVPRKVFPQEFGRDDRSFYRSFPATDGKVWFSTRGQADAGLYRYDPVAETWEEMSELPGYPSGSAVASVAEAPDGTFWFGMYRRPGLWKFVGDRFLEVPLPSMTAGLSVLGLRFDRSGRLWVATTGGGVVRLDRPTASDPAYTAFTEAEGLSSNNVRCLTEGRDGAIYAGTIRGVSRIDPDANTIRRITTADGLAADFVHDAFSASDDTIWFGTENGVSKLTPAPPPVETSPTIYISDVSIAGIEYAISPFGQRDVTGIEVPASENNIQVNFASVGAPDQAGFIYRLEGSSTDTWSAPVATRTLNFANLSPGEYKLHIAPAAVGAEGTTPSTVSFTIKPPFYRAWWFLLLAFLVAVASIVALDRYRAGKTKEVKKALVLSRESETRFRTLAETASDAILTIDEESTIVFANESIEKIFGYTPNEVIGKSLTMLMPERMRGGHQNGLARYLGSGSKNISWDGVELPGLHKSGDEIPLEVSFGEFGRDGNRYFTGIARDISERKRAEAALQRSREERVAELQRIRSRIATDLHDDIGSSLTQISVYSELARQQGKDNGKTLGPLAMITNISNELVDTMSDIVWAINPKKDHLADLTQRMRRYAANALSAKDIEMTFTAPDSGNKLPLGANIRREVFLIFKETINNIVKHSHAKNTEISLEVRPHSMEIRFVDDGAGFDESKAVNEDEPDWKRFRGGNGLHNMRRRAEELGGRCEIESTVGVGTRVRLEIPFEPGGTSTQIST